MIGIKTTCPYCGKQTIINVDELAWGKYQKGEFIQKAFPELNPAQREMLITGICPECWDRIFDDE